MRHYSMDVVTLPQCEKELADFPEEIRDDFFDCAAKLGQGLVLSMPLSRPMPSMGKGIHELRLKDRAGEYRIIYFIKKADGIYFVHAFHKKTRQTPQKNIYTALQRINRL